MARSHTRGIALFLTLALVACGGARPTAPGGGGGNGTGGGGGGGTGGTTNPPPTLLRGVSLSPSGFPADFSHLNDFFNEVAGFGRGAVMWNGAWRDDAVNGTDAGTLPAGAGLVADAAQGGTRFAPVAVFGWRSGQTLFIRVPANQTNDWSNTAARTAFATVVRTFAATYHPKLLFLGNESDFYAEQNAADYVRWVAAYNDAYDAIKAASPETRVGPIFSVEHMMGWGAFSGWTTPHTEAFTLHDRSRIDVVGLTLYPYLGRAAAADVPANYLDPVFALLGNIPIAITETGWPASAGTPVAWQPGDSQQTTYLGRLSTMIQGHSALLVNWLFLYPLSAGSPDALTTFGTVSLRDQAGNKRAVYDAFLGLGSGQ